MILSRKSSFPNNNSFFIWSAIAFSSSFIICFQEQMGQTQDTLIAFDDVKYAQERPDNFVIINTLPMNQQDCVISGTLEVEKETVVMEALLVNAREKPIVVYGRNDTDVSVETKAQQLKKLGFRHIFIYRGGLFEWLMLRDIYGVENFRIDGNGKGDILDFQPAVKFPTVFSEEKRKQADLFY